MTQEQALKYVLLVQQGNGECFSDIYDAFVDKIYGFVYSKTHHKQTAEDIVSQVFFKAWEKIQSYDETKGNFSTWIYRIASNTVIDHYRSVKQVQDIDDIWDLSSSEDIERDTGIKLQLEQVQEFMSELKADQRDIVLMRVWQDLSFKEIAEITGKSEGSCKMTYKRSIEKIRNNVPLAAFILFLIKPF